MNTPTVLIVEDDIALLEMLSLEAQQRGYAVSRAATLAAARQLIDREIFQLAVIDLMLGGESGFDAIRAIRAQSLETEIVVISGAASLASALDAYDLDAFAFVPKPFQVDQLFATVERALEHRSVVLSNRRLLWEQQLINDVGEELRHLLEPEELLHRVLRRLMRGMRLDCGAARLLNPATGDYDLRVVSAPEAVSRQWSTFTAQNPRPSDRVLATRAPVRISNLHDGLDPATAADLPVCSALSVPMFAGEDLIGVLSIASPEPGRFTADDERVVCVIANQAAVGVQNARLHTFIRAAKQEWEATFDAISDPIAVFNQQGRLLRGNTALAAALGLPVTALRGLTCDAVGLCGGKYPDCAVGHATGSVCEHGEVTRPGERIYNVTTCPVPEAPGGAAIVQIAKDVTLEIQTARRMRQMSDELAATNGRLLATVERLKATQAQLLQAEKLSAIGQLVAGVAHELNNPLTSVIGYAQLLQEEVREADESGAPAPSGLAHDLRRIAEESERAAKIVRNLLAFARRQSAARSEQDVADLMTRVLSLRAYEFRLNAIEVESRFESGLPAVLGDGGQLQQALLNLLLNAEQAMRARTVRRISVGARRVPDADAIEIFIADTGHGIPEENLRRIFDPFFTTREVGEGTGLGLSICYGIVRDHGGQISVESRVGQGTTFKVLLPARSQEDRLRVLVAHRDPTERDYVAAALAGWGHDVTTAESADDARGRLASGSGDVALVDHAFIAADPAGWRDAFAAGGGHAALILMSEASGTEGVAPPFELAALRGALRGISKECV
ncbi:MAG TPA: ATP-binding protein [Vicinamibacterales bacterium]|nr:ATP-binding protein [Vicinamibacterales bacterium]